MGEKGGELCMFIGEYQHSIDPKGRLIMPSKYREALGTAFIITKGLDQCLFAYTLKEWEIFTNKLTELNMGKKNARAAARFFFSGAVEIEIDKQGRALIPANLRLYANLNKDVCIAGVHTRIEIWDREKWTENAEMFDMDAFEENMSEFSL
jgi:MraZ protein